MSGLINKILVSLDGFGVADQALPMAEHLAAQAGAELILFRAVSNSPLEVTLLQGMPAFELNAQKQQEIIDLAMVWLEQMAARLTYQGITTRGVVDVGDPAARILAYAEADDIDLIVMSSHDRRGVPRLVHSSVAAKVFAGAPCSVMLVRPQIVEQGHVLHEESKEVVTPL